MDDNYFENKAKILEIFQHYFTDKNGNIEKEIDVHDFDLLSTLISRTLSIEAVKKENRIITFLKRCVIRRRK
jgi:hypothetical protein